MANDRLRVNYVEKKTPPSFSSDKRGNRQELQAKMERLWLTHPQMFNPERDCLQRERLTRTFDALHQRTSFEGKHVADLGCGSGVFSRRLRNAGAKVDAVDVASQPLQLLKNSDSHNITPLQDYLPETRLNDNAYDIVVCTEVIGYLNPSEYRVTFSELARILKLDGFVVCSTDLDFKTEDPLEIFASLAETEFIIDQWVLSYHRLFIKVCHFFEAPAIYIKASSDPEAYQQGFKRRAFFNRWWFSVNSTKIMSYFWKVINVLTSPIAKGIKNSKGLMLALEKITKLLWSQSGISHAIFVGRKRPLTFPLPPKEIPREMKHKRQTWE